MTRIIGVVSGKGGVGKTTIVSNLGAALATEFDRETIIVDCNLTTSHLGLHMGLHYAPVSINHVLKGSAKISEAIYDHENKLKIIPASMSVKELSGLDVADLKKHIRNLFGKADVVLLDSAPGLGREALATLHASDEVLFVATPYITSTLDVLRCKEIVNDMEHLSGLSQLGVVLNMVENKQHELKKADVESLTELPVLASIPSDKKVQQSLVMKIPVVSLEKNSKPSREFKKLGAAILREDYRPSRLSRFSLFRWLR